MKQYYIAIEIRQNLLCIQRPGRVFKWPRSQRGQAAAKKIIIHAEARRRGEQGDVFYFLL
jgi:hypothetical protein